MHWLAEVASNLWFVVKQLTIISAQIVLAIMVLLTVISVILSLIRLVKEEYTKEKKGRGVCVDCEENWFELKGKIEDRYDEVLAELDKMETYDDPKRFDLLLAEHSVLGDILSLIYKKESEMLLKKKRG